MSNNHQNKRKALSIKDKLGIIEKVDSNPCVPHVLIAKELGLATSTLSTILSKRDELIAQAGNTSLNIKRLKKSKYLAIEEPLIEWFKQQRALNIPLNGGIIREKAEQIALRLNIDFHASNGWLDRFKNRFNIVYKTVSGESGSVQQDDVDAWKLLLPNLLSGYQAKDIFNADEFGLFFNLLPDKTFAYKGEVCHGGKRSKERLTVLAGANMNGSEKLPLLVIGKPKKPRCFKNIKVLPCKYENNKSAWMTCAIFEQYLRSLDAKMGCQNRKILLFIDHCPAHPTVNELRNIKVIFLPANSTSVLQPMDQGIIKVLKQRFRKRLVCKVILKMKPGCQPYKLSILDAMHYLVACWDSIEPVTISNCFRKSGFNIDEVSLYTNDSTDGEKEEEDDDDHEENNIAWERLKTNLNFSCSFQTYVSVDNNILPAEQWTIEELCDEQMKKQSEKIEEVEVEKDEDEDEVEEEEEEIQETSKPSCAEALNSFTIVQSYIEGATEVPDHVWKSVLNLEQFLFTQSLKTVKQKKIGDFFLKKSHKHY